MSLHHLYVSTTTSTCLPPPLHVYTTSICLHHLYMRTPPLCVYHHLYVSTTTSMCLPPPLRVYTTSMACSAHLWVYTTCMSVAHICESTPPLYVYTTSTCLRNSTCLSHPTCLPYLYMSILHPHVYHSFAYLIQFRTHGEFENENNFALAP